LGEAYAFGVIWSFTFNSLAMLVLRFKYKGERGWKVPPNIKIGNIELPLGLASVHLVLLSVAITNLLTKSLATKVGVVFALAFFIIFYFSEKHNAKIHAAHQKEMKEHFQLEQQEHIQADVVGVRPGNVLVTVRDYNTLTHLRWILERTDTADTDVVVLSARMTGPGSAEYDLSTEQIFSDYEQKLFTNTVSIAEKVGKTVSLMVIPARDVFSAIVQTANNLESSAIVAGLSSKMSAEEQAFRLGQAWEAMPQPKHQIVFQVVHPDGKVDSFRIGPHTPTMKTEDVHLVHKMWLTMRRRPGTEELHHSDIVTLALTRLAQDFARNPDEILRALATDGRRTLLGASQKAALPPPPPGSTPPAERDRRTRERPPTEPT
jgi:uncharacterized membrane protein